MTTSHTVEDGSSDDNAALAHKESKVTVEDSAVVQGIENEISQLEELASFI